uniref:Uncharacterized protein n=1 Tax=Rhizophora mucronata TaxID=61149 RepID=A0A2P2QSQ2_RHIMU
MKKSIPSTEHECHIYSCLIVKAAQTCKLSLNCKTIHISYIQDLRFR